MASRDRPSPKTASDQGFTKSEPLLYVRAERDYDWNGHRELVRIKYREVDAPPNRKWTSFLVFPQEGQTLGSLMNARMEIAHLHYEGKVSK